MSTLSISIFVDVNHPADFTIKHSTTKADSITKSVFQRVGLAYKTADLIAHRIAANPHAGKSSLVADLLNMGFSKEQSEVLLSAKNWDLRMELAWHFIKPIERRRAKKLDYSQYENYWQNLDFLNTNNSTLPNDALAG
jgi:hypothetical protein